MSNTNDTPEHRTNVPKFLEFGIDCEVATMLDDVCKACRTELDERVLTAVADFPPEAALNILSHLLKLNHEYVPNKSAYIYGAIKRYAQRSPNSKFTTPLASNIDVKKPAEDKIKHILDRTGYSFEITLSQRRYGGPPPNWDGRAPGIGCEVFCGNIPNNILEYELIPLFETCGKIWEFRLIMDPFTGRNMGYAFIIYTTTEAALSAVRQFAYYEIKVGVYLRVTVTVPKRRLFVDNIPNNKSKEEIFSEFSKISEGLTEVFTYNLPNYSRRNAAFCFLEYDTHRAAWLAKSRLVNDKIKVWGCDIFIAWDLQN